MTYAVMHLHLKSMLCILYNLKFFLVFDSLGMRGGVSRGSIVNPSKTNVPVQDAR